MNRLIGVLGLACVLAGLYGLGCYDTTKPAPPCTVSGANGCYPLVHDRTAPDGGR